MSLSQTRQKIINAAQGAVRTNGHWQYGEVRPIPYATFNAILDGGDEEITTDCSGLATCCYYRAGAEDPNHQGYDGQGFTGTMLQSLPGIDLRDAQPGDLVVFGAYPGVHVVVITGTGGDPMCVSHGKPGDPHEAPLSAFTGLGTMNILRGVPRVKPIRKPSPYKWRVTGDGDKSLGGAHGTLRWELRHPRQRRQHEQLLFHAAKRATGETNQSVKV